MQKLSFSAPALEDDMGSIELLQNCLPISTKKKIDAKNRLFHAMTHPKGNDVHWILNDLIVIKTLDDVIIIIFKYRDLKFNLILSVIAYKSLMLF